MYSRYATDPFTLHTFLNRRWFLSDLVYNLDHVV
jgi:hypothetical protein